VQHATFLLEKFAVAIDKFDELYHAAQLSLV